MVPAIKRRSPKLTAFQTLIRQCCRTHRQILSFTQNTPCRRSKNSVSFPLSLSYSTPIPLSSNFLMISTYLATELHVNRWKIGHCDLWTMFQVTEHNTSQATRFKHRLSIIPGDAKNRSHWRHGPAMHRWWQLNLVTGDNNSPRCKATWTTVTYYWYQNPDSIVNFRWYMFCLLVVLVKLSLLAKWLARKTLLRKPNRGEGIFSIKPRPKRAYDCVGLLYFCCCFIAWYLCSQPALCNTFPTSMACYSLFVLKMP